MMWQKARILGDNHSNPMVGRTVWVEAKKPELKTAGTWNGPLRCGIYPAYTSNVIHSDGVRRCILAAHSAELLSGPDDFADDVPIISWNDFLRGEQ